MEILHPTLLFGLIAAVTPVVIYLLLRRRRHEVRWGAGYLLRLTLASRRKSSLWRQIVILTVRSLILALMALLLAQFLRRNPHPAAQRLAPPPQPVHRVVLYDNSLSMATPEGGMTRADRMRAALECILRSQRGGDVATLIPLVLEHPGAPPAAVTVPGAWRVAQVEATLGGIRLREGTLALASALAEGRARLAATPQAGHELYILSDFPRELEAESRRLGWWRGAAGGVRVTPVNLALAGAATGNAAVHRLTCGTDWAIAGVPFTLYADVENCSDLAAAATLDVRVDGRAAGRIQAALQPNERRWLTQTLAFTTPGTVTVAVAAAGAPAVSGGASVLALDVRPAPLVWVLAAPAAAGGASDLPGEGELLLRALATQTGERPLLRLETPAPRAFTQAIPDNVDAIVVAGFPVTPAMGRPFAEFVRRGGGLVLALGPGVSPAAWNENLAELLPAVLEQPWRDAVDPEVFLAVSPASRDMAQPLFAEFATARNGAVGDIRVYNYFRTREPGPGVAVVLSLVGGEPYVLQRALGRGEIVLLTSSLGVSWSSLAVQRVQLPLLFRMLAAAAAGRGFPRNLEPGAPLLLPWPSVEEVTLVRPDQSRTTLRSAAGTGSAFLAVAGPTERGPYALIGHSGRRDAFTVRGAAPECDLRSVTAPQAALLAASLGTEIRNGWAAAVAEIGAADRVQPWWPWLLAGLLLLYLFETWFVRTI